MSNIIDSVLDDFAGPEISYGDGKPDPAGIKDTTNINGKFLHTLNSGQQVVEPSPEMASALQGAYKAYPDIPKGHLEALTMKESSMGYNKANYNPDIGENAWNFGITKPALAELKLKGIKTDVNTLAGAAKAAAAYYSLSNGKYPDAATQYKQGYNGSTTMPFNPVKYNSSVDFYAKM